MEHADPVPPIISVENLEHRYGDFTAVDTISFTVKKGEIFSFLGPNGAGKSTVINILITLLARQKGTAVVAGYDVTAQPQQVRESIGIVFQDITLDRDMTVRETLEFHGRLYNMPVSERRARIDELLKLVQLDTKRDELTKRLSGGMKRRLEIARGLMTRPKILFLDEPTIGLDPQTRMRMWEYIKNVNNEGTTIFLTTHYMDEADQLSDRISIIDHGKIVITGTSGELKNTLGRDLIYLETDNNDAAVRILKDVAAVRDVRIKSGGFVLTVHEDGTKILPSLIDTLRKNGIEISTINLKKPTMDDVFVHYTGKELRDEGAAPARAMHLQPRGR
ncbi:MULTISPECIES: ATP-binding cassette domain-containing protein [unclassified Methanoregula]|uniref:ATP-binding cassette domain-containing protein n=1 Tax=unclassified Methanoregula TaxID=2649730 RepID=UPI0009CCC8A2|nr:MULTISPECIES: ATP-binding cassette domain-containing protein [unclassified Methanoregula]OPX63927.1 MAG: putative branched-chain amino acid transport ATP-binding protein LivG [Methanoregula sp. PtaB.Bin085]OPY35479.1 MAG: putative branched-chain amino acid transport ATP-binding protein LivG [Methanoregula sp. PtaU1.Bin006]